METRAWLQERHQPVLMVAADPAAEAMCMERNGLSLVDVLRPFSHLTQLQVAFRIGEASLRVRELKVRFHAAATIQQPSPEAIEEHLARRLAAAAAQYATPERDVLVDLMSRRGPPPSVSLTPWYSEYRDEFLRLLRFGCHETLDHPVGALLVVPAGVPNAVSAFEALMVDPSAMPAAMRPAPTERQQPQQVQSPPPPPPQQQQQQQQQAGGGGGDGGGGASASGSGAGGGGKGGTGSGAGGCGLGHGSGPHVEWMYPVRDRDFARHYVLLLDGSVPPDAALNKRAADNIAACREVFGQEHVSLLRINTAKGGPECAGALPTFYRSFQRTGLPGGVAGDPEYLLPVPAAGLGAALSAVDLDSISATIRRAVGQSVLPMLERRINRLNDGITAARRGLRNRLTRMWKAAADDTVVDRPYPWHSIEGQMRQLADLAFLLQHFEFAASVYRLAAQDYLAHNNLRWYAGAEEMISLCCVLDPSDGSDPLKYSTRAYEHYSRLPGKLPRMLASRAMMLCALYQSSAGRHLSANHVLMRAHFEEENARAALLLEQAAYSLLYLPQPGVRKFAFQMVLAGLRYHSCGQRRLAMTAYRQVLRVYAGKGWRAILEHLHDVLGKHLREAGDEAGALDSAAQLLTCMGRSAPTQQHYLDHFLGLATRAQHSGSSVSQPGTSAGTSAGAAPSLSPPLPLPHVDARDVRVRFDGSSCSGGGGGGGGVCGGGAGPLPDRGAASGGSSGVGASPPQARQLGLQHHQRDVSDEVWASMEGAVSNDGAGGGGGNWLDGGGGGSGGARGGGAMRDGEQYNTVVAGELVNVSVRFRNPLAVALSLAHVRLVVDFENDGSGGETAVATSSGTAGQQPAALTASAPAAAVSAAAAAAGVSVRAAPPAPATCGAAPPGGLGDSGDSGNLDPLSARPRAPRGPPTSAHVSLSHAAFTLHPGEAHTQELTVTVAAGASGWLRVAGCAWVLGGVAHGSVSFEPMGRRRKAPAGERPGQRKDIAPHRRLLFSAIGAAPRLELSVEGLPQRMAPSASPSTAFSTAGAAAAAAAAAAAVGSAWAPGGGGGQQPGQQHPAAGAASGASGAAVGAGAGTRGPLLLAGELVMATCVLRNAGSAPATALALALRGGPAALPASDAALESSLRSGSSSSSSLMDVLAGRGGAGAVAVQAASASAAAARHAAGGGDASTATQVHRAWPGVVLLPGEELRWPLLLHASVPGPSLELQMVWYCEPQVPDKAMKARLLRCALSLPVAPLLTLSAHLSRSSADLRVRGLSLRVDADAGAPGAVELAQLACWGGGGGGGWRMCSATGEGTAAEAAAAGALRLPHGSAPPLQPGETAALELRLVPPSVHPAAAAGGPAASAAMPNYAPPSLPPLPPAAPPAPPGHSLDLDLLSSPGPLLHALLTQGAGSVGWSGPHTARQKAPGGAAGAGAAALALPPRADLPVDVLMAWRLPGGSGGGASVGVSRLRDATRAAARPLVHPLRLQLSGGRGTTTTAAFCGATPAGGVATAPGAAAPQHTTGPRGGVAPGAAPGATTAQPGSGTMTLIVARHSFATAGSACVVPLSLSVVNLAGVDAGSVGVQAGAAWGSGEERGPAWSCSAPAAAAAAAAGSGAGAAPTPGSYHGAPQGAPGQAQAQQQVQQQAHQPRATVSLGGGGGPMGAHAPPAPAPPAAAAGLPAMPEYSWVGQTRAQLGALAAGQAARVELAVLVLRPGTFVVRGVHAVCTYGAGQKVVADAGELLLRVEDAS